MVKKILILCVIFGSNVFGSEESEAFKNFKAKADQAFSKGDDFSQEDEDGLMQDAENYTDKGEQRTILRNIAAAKDYVKIHSPLKKRKDAPAPVNPLNPADLATASQAQHTQNPVDDKGYDVKTAVDPVAQKLAFDAQDHDAPVAKAPAADAAKPDSVFNKKNGIIALVVLGCIGAGSYLWYKFFGKKNTDEQANNDGIPAYVKLVDSLKATGTRDAQEALMLLETYKKDIPNKRVRLFYKEFSDKLTQEQIKLASKVYYDWL